MEFFEIGEALGWLGEEPGSCLSTASRSSCSAEICWGAGALFLTRGGPREDSMMGECEVQVVDTVVNAVTSYWSEKTDT